MIPHASDFNIKYPQNDGNPTLKTGKIIFHIMILSAFIITLWFSSCKTCNCPAYSMTQETTAVTISSDPVSVNK
jgi:hypothetical protein